MTTPQIPHQIKEADGCRFRRIKPEEYPVLTTFLYEAIYVPEGMEPPPLSIVSNPEVSFYIKDFGRAGDICLVCEAHKQIVGAAWSRILDGEGERGYGNIGAGIPELAISVLPGYRGRGIGLGLLQRLHIALGAEGYDRISLSVQKANPAFRLYERAGYRVLREQEDDYIMVWEGGGTPCL
jgi:GNAT superfamily N-acetyltransferase